MAASDEAGALMRVADAPRHCGDCVAFALLRDAIASALLQGGLGQVLTGQPIQAREALPTRALGSDHRANADLSARDGKHRAAVQGCLARIDVARKAITATARDGQGLSTAVQRELWHYSGVIAKETQKARETLAGVR